MAPLCLHPLKIVRDAAVRCAVPQPFRTDGVQMESQCELSGSGQSALDPMHFFSSVFTEKNLWNNKAINQVHRPERAFKH